MLLEEGEVIVPLTHSRNKVLLLKGQNVTMLLDNYRDLFTHTHAASGMHYMYADQQAVYVWNRTKHH